jgi:acid phosphatase (class A)
MRSSQRFILMGVVCLFSFVLVISSTICWCEESPKFQNISSYLSAQELPDSILIIPPPPSPGSASFAFALDVEVNNKSLALRNTPIWSLAAKDTNINFPQEPMAFSCALGIPINEHDTPRLFLVMQKSIVDLIIATYGAKGKYARTRPFSINKQPICSPGEEDHLTKSGSYPSGHSSIGWGWALILAEIAQMQFLPEDDFTAKIV